MNSSIKIRSAQSSDVGDMSCLLTQLFSIEDDFSPDDEKQSRGLELLLKSSSAKVLVAEEQGRVVGMVTVQILISTAEGGRVGQVEDVVVDQDKRGRSIGTALLNAMQRWAKDNGLSRLQLAADAGNSGALEFYVTNGWKHTSMVLLRFGC